MMTTIDQPQIAQYLAWHQAGGSISADEAMASRINSALTEWQQRHSECGHPLDPRSLRACDHTQALIENLEHNPAQYDVGRWDRAHRMAMRAGVKPIPYGYVARDEREAYSWAAGRQVSAWRAGHRRCMCRDDVCRLSCDHTAGRQLNADRPDGHPTASRAAIFVDHCEALAENDEIDATEQWQAWRDPFTYPAKRDQIAADEAAAYDFPRDVVTDSPIHPEPHIVNGECQCNCRACGDDHCICPGCQHPGGMRAGWMTR